MDVKVAGRWLQQHGAVSSVTWSDRWGEGPCGPDLASCSFAVDPGNDARWLRVGQPAEVHDDHGLVLGGVVAEVGRGFPREIHIRGWARRGEDYDAVDGSGNPTNTPQTAVQQAIGRGLQWNGYAAFSSSSIGTTEPTTRRLNDLLTQWATTTGQRWGVDAHGNTFVTADPTAATDGVDYYLDAEGLDIGVADDGFFTRVRARYVSGVDGGGNPSAWSTATADDATAQAEFDVIEYPMDLTALGPISPTTALSYAAQQLALLTQPQWLSRARVTIGQLRTPGGNVAHLPAVRAGQLLRLHNVPTNIGGIRGELGIDVVIGETQHSDDDPASITIAPVNLAVRSLADEIADRR